MKRTQMIQNIMRFVYDATDCEIQIDTDEAALILQFIEKAGMLPPKITLSTPLGARIILETNEWEEDAKYDEAGYTLGENPINPDTPQAKVIR